jgi:hypothetical protein
VARKVEVRLIDDLDGGEADETVEFGVDGTMYEIDLSAEHANELREILERYVEAGTRQRAGRVPGQRVNGSGPRRANKADKEQNQAIREWAQRRGIDVASRGRIKQEIVDQYHATGGASADPEPEPARPARGRPRKAAARR